MKKIINWFLYQDGHLDWLKHLILGTVAYLLTLGAMEFIQDDLGTSLIVAVFASVGLGVAKEIYDKFNGRESEGRDIVCTFIGGLIITIIIAIIK